MILRQPTCWAEDGHATIVYLYLSCVRAKNTVQSLLRDVGRCCKGRCHQKRCGGMGCAVVHAASQ